MNIEININTKAKEVYKAIGFMSVTEYIKLLQLIHNNGEEKQKEDQK